MPLNLSCNVQLSFQIWNLLAAVTGALLIDKVGRRALFILSSAGMLTCQYLQSFAPMVCYANDIVNSIFGVVSHHVPHSHEFYNGGY